MHLTYLGVLLLNIIWLLSSGSAFILDGQKCIAYPPCTCSGDRVYCNSKSLTTFPKFEVSNITGSSLYLYMYSNQLTSIPANAFSNLTVSKSTIIYLYIYSNRINSVSANAFKGIADRIVEIRIYNNNLTQVPTAFKSLHNLNYLNIQDNPISTLSSSYDIMHSLVNLRTFYIDLKGFSAWPTELNILEPLQTLYVRYINATHLDFNAFQGLEDTLHTLSISYSQLERIPVAVCHLQHLITLELRNNRNVKINGTLFEACKTRLTSVTTIDISGNNLRQFPDILRSFPSVRTLHVNHNQLMYIHWDSVPGNMSLTHLYMSYNHLTRIPTVINKFHSLTYLDLHSNKIVSIEDTDLRNMVKLQYLILVNNPIEYISPHAFQNNHALTLLYLDGIKINQLPLSIAGLTNLRTLYLQNVPIECNCGLKVFYLTHISRISGYCKSSAVTIKSYITNNLQHCN